MQAFVLIQSHVFFTSYILSPLIACLLSEYNFYELNRPEFVILSKFPTACVYHQHYAYLPISKLSYYLKLIFPLLVHCCMHIALRILFPWSKWKDQKSSSYQNLQICLSIIAVITIYNIYTYIYLLISRLSYYFKAVFRSSVYSRV